jgi:Protein of unknown function (DUF3014)
LKLETQTGGIAMNKYSIAAVAAALLTVLGLGGLYWWQRAPRAGVPPPEPVAVAPAPAAPAPAPAPAIKHPIDVSAAASGPAMPTTADPQALWRAGLGELVGQKAMLRFLLVDDFAHRIVATVDNLARPHAAPRLWPVAPVGGRFSVVGEGEQRIVAADNAARYAPLVGFIASVDARRAAALYVRMYPQLQAAYEELGYPGRYLNDRVVDVIDHLLQTPELAEPLGIHVTEVKGDVPSAQPWLRYEFSDPALQSLSSGQKMLLRVGPAHRKTLMSKLAELRSLVTRAPATR